VTAAAVPVAALGRLGGTLKNGTATSGMWVRATFCLQKIDGNWLIAHDQVSVPLYIPSGKGVTEIHGLLSGRSADLLQQPVGFGVGRVRGQHAPECGTSSGPISLGEGELRRQYVCEQVLPLLDILVEDEHGRQRRREVFDLGRRAAERAEDNLLLAFVSQPT